MIGRTKDFSWFSIFLGSMAVYILQSLLMLHIDSVNQTVFFFFFSFLCSQTILSGPKQCLDLHRGVQ